MEAVAEPITTQIEAPPVATQAETTAISTEPKEHIDVEPNLDEEIKAKQERLKKLQEDEKYWRKQKAEARADYFRSRGEPRVEPTPTRPIVSVEPRPEDFENYDLYNKALIDHRVAEKRKEWEAEQQQKKVKEEQETRMAILHQKMEEGYKKHEDFEEVALDPVVPITPMIVEALTEFDEPDEIAYYLGKNRAEAIKISKMTPLRATRELTRIEFEIQKARAGNPPPSGPKKITNAPPPIKPLNQGGTGGNEKPLDKMTQAEFEAEMERRTGRRY